LVPADGIEPSQSR